jgi:hypothetical protein
MHSYMILNIQIHCLPSAIIHYSRMIISLYESLMRKKKFFFLMIHTPPEK